MMIIFVCPSLIYIIRQKSIFVNTFSGKMISFLLKWCFFDSFSFETNRKPITKSSRWIFSFYFLGYFSINTGRLHFPPYFIS